MTNSASSATPFALLEKSAFGLPNVNGAIAGGIAGAQQGATQGMQQGIQTQLDRSMNNVRQGNRDTAIGLGKTVGHAVSTPFRGMWGGLSGGVKGAWNSRGKGGKGIMEGAAAGAAGGVYDQMAGVQAGMQGGIGQAVGGMGQTARGAGQAVTAPAIGAAQGLWGGAKGAYGGAMAGGFPKSASVTAFAALEKEATQIGTGNRRVNSWQGAAVRPPANQPVAIGTGGQQAAPGQGATAQTRPAAGQPIAIGAGNQQVAPGQGATVQTRPAPNAPIAIGTGNRTVAPGQDVTVQTGLPDLTKDFRKYHGTSFDPNSSMDRGKLQQMQELFKEHGKLSPSLVYGRQYGTKSASVTAFAALGDGMEKEAASWLQRGLGWGAQRLGASAHKARVALKGKADEAASTAYDAALAGRKGQRGMAGRGIAEESARRAGTEVLDSGSRVGSRRATGADWLNQAANKIGVSPGLQKGINYGGAGVAGTGALYGANRLGHGSGRKSGLSDGYDAGGYAATAAMQDSPGYLGGLMQAIAGRQPYDAAAMRHMLDQNKDDILRTILRGRA